LKTIALTFAAFAATLSGCASLEPAAASANGAVRYGENGEMLVLDAKLKAGSSREDLLKSVAKAVQAQLSGGIEANAAVTTSFAAARYPLDQKKPVFTPVDPATLDSATLRSTFVDGHAFTCPRAALVTHGINTDSAATDENVAIFVCVMPYEGGYRTVAYASYKRSSLPSALHKDGRFDGASFTKTAFGTIRSAIEAHASHVAILPGAGRKQD
jgi:hypothetical protein